MGSSVRLEHCRTAGFDPAAKAHVPGHATFRTFLIWSMTWGLSEGSAVCQAKGLVCKEEKTQICSWKGWEGAAKVKDSPQRAR